MPNSTFAWFAASQEASVSALTNTNSGNINVDKHASVDSLKMRIKVNWPNSFSNVDLTAGATKAARQDTEDVAQVIGGAYVIDANGDVKPNISNQVVKARTVSFTLATAVGGDHGIQTKIANTGVDANDWRDATNDEIALLVNSTLTVKVDCDGQLRVGTSLIADGDGAGAVGAKSAQPISLGTATVTSVAAGVITYTYAPTLDLDSQSDSFDFYYSASPKDNEGTGDYDAAGTGTSDQKNYGKFTVSLDLGN